MTFRYAFDGKTRELKTWISFKKWERCCPFYSQSHISSTMLTKSLGKNNEK